jgi:hypothetical protein
MYRHGALTLEAKEALSWTGCALIWIPADPISPSSVRFKQHNQTLRRAIDYEKINKLTAPAVSNG